jgi:hypothetical protein
MPIEPSSPFAGRARAATALAQPRGARVEITLDAFDTGERKTIGGYEARHVITTRTVEPTPGAQTSRSSTVTDGWYLDLPALDCRAPGDSPRAATALLSVLSAPAGRPPDSLDVKWLRKAHTGFAIDETQRFSHPGGTVVTKTELVEASAAPLASSVFDVPDGYRPALPLPAGQGFDLSRPDTLSGRLSTYWDLVSAWVRSITRRAR